MTGPAWGEQSVAAVLAALTAEHAETQLRFEAAAQAAGIGTFLLDLASGALDWDGRMQELFGYAPGEFRARLDAGFDRVHPQDRRRVEAAVAEAVAATRRVRRRLPGRAARRSRTPPRRPRPGHAGSGWRTGHARRRDLGRHRAAHGARRGRPAARDDGHRLRRPRPRLAHHLRQPRGRPRRRPPRRGARRPGRSGRPSRGSTSHEFGRLYRECVRRGEPVEAEAWYDHLGGWFHVRAVPTDDGLSLYFTDVTGRHADQERAEAAAARLQLLSAVSTELADAGFDVEGAVARLARMVVPGLADWALVSLTDGPRAARRRRLARRPGAAPGRRRSTSRTAWSAAATWAPSTRPGAPAGRSSWSTA